MSNSRDKGIGRLEFAQFWRNLKTPDPCHSEGAPVEGAEESRGCQSLPGSIGNTWRVVFPFASLSQDLRFESSGHECCFVALTVKG